MCLERYKEDLYDLVAKRQRRQKTKISLSSLLVYQLVTLFPDRPGYRVSLSIVFRAFLRGPFIHRCHTGTRQRSQLRPGKVAQYMNPVGSRTWIVPVVYVCWLADRHACGGWNSRIGENERPLNIAAVNM
jgi:hypothetical protein